MSFTRGGRLGQDRSPSRPVPTPWHPPKRMPQAPQHHDADDAPAGALDKCGYDARSRVTPHNVTHPPMRQLPHPWWSAQFSSQSSPTACATLRWRMPRPPAPMWRRSRTLLVTPPGGQEPHRHHQRRVLPRLRQQAATRHFARVHGVGLLRHAGPGDVPVVPQHHRLLVPLL
jgi:hypothetical protein